MSFHGTPCHVELGSDFGVIASLQEQVYDLLFARTEPNSLLFHPILPFFWICLTDEVRGLITKSHSIHVAIVSRISGRIVQKSFPQALADRLAIPNLGPGK